MPHPIPAEAEIRALQGHRFPGGSYCIEHWENYLLTECTGAEQMPAGLAHPVALFHMPIFGSGTSIAEMFELGQAESDLSIIIESYDWEIFTPLQEAVNYRIDGCITSAERRHNKQGKPFDRIQFGFDVSLAKEPVARTTITWHYTRNTL